MKRQCKGCTADISHKHPNAKFHSTKCKDRFHNANNPRGKFAHLKNIMIEDPGDDEYYNGKDFL